MSQLLDRQLLTAAANIEYVLTWVYSVDLEEDEKLYALLGRLRDNPTLVVSAFPGVGKTYYYNNTEDVVLDSDSSKFDKAHFPGNYIQHIKENIGKVDVILVSSHQVVRQALIEAGVDFALVYPSLADKEEYIEKYKRRGSSDSFIRLVEDNWESWIEECEDQRGCFKYQLDNCEYLSDLK